MALAPIGIGGGMAPGGPPPMMPGAPGGTGPAMAPGPMPGAGQQALSQVKLAVEALQKALPNIPMGSDLHTAVLNAVSGVTKHLDDSGIGQPSHEDVVQQLAMLARQGQQGANPLAAMMPPGPGAPPPGGAEPPPPAV